MRDFKRNLTGKVSRILLWRVLKYSQPTIKSRSFAQTRVSRSSKRANREFPKRRHVGQDRFQGFPGALYPGSLLKGVLKSRNLAKTGFHEVLRDSHPGTVTESVFFFPRGPKTKHGAGSFLCSLTTTNNEDVGLSLVMCPRTPAKHFRGIPCVRGSSTQ